MPEKMDATFAETLQHYVKQRVYSHGQLAQVSGLPKRTVSNWLSGIVERPRDWRDLLKVAAALRLDEAETNHLLQSARYPDIIQLLAQEEGETERHLLRPWAKVAQQRLAISPFQAIADLPYFVGRKTELTELKQVLLGNGRFKICSLHGMAGTGKTSLAAHLAYELRSCFPDGILWARVDTSDAMSILNSFARAFGLDVDCYKDIESRSRVVRELLADKRVMIILDNVESSGQAQPLLPPSGVCAVVLTSRKQDLAVARGSHRFQIGPFDRREDSFNLFIQILGREFAEREQETLLEIADLLGHLPLALDIAASRIAHEPGWSAADFLERLRRDEGALKQGAFNQGILNQLVYENQNVRLSFQMSYQELSSHQQFTFHVLGLFGGEDFNVDAVAHIASIEPETARDILRALYGLSLVQLSRPDRYRLHPLLRNLALEAEITGTTMERMVAFFVRYAETNHADYAALDLEITNITAALDAAFQYGLNPLLIRGIEALFNYWDSRGLYAQANSYLNRSLQIVESMGDLEATAVLLYKQALISIRCGQIEAAEENLHRGLILTGRLKSPQTTSSLLLGYLGLIAFFRCDYLRMESFLLEALDLAQAVHQDEIVCRLFEGLNGLAQQRSDYPAAERYCRQGLALARQLGNRELIVIHLKGLASTLFEKGEDDSIIHEYLLEGLKIARELEHRQLICSCLLSLGYTVNGRGDPEQAQIYLQEALRLTDETHLPIERTYIISTLGLMELNRGMFSRSEAYLCKSLELTRQLELLTLAAPIQNALGWLHFHQQKWELSARAFIAAQEMACQNGMRADIAQALFGLSRVSAAQGDFQAARRRGKESLAILEEIGHRAKENVIEWILELKGIIYGNQK